MIKVEVEVDVKEEVVEKEEKVEVKKENMFKVTNTDNGIIIHYPKSIFLYDSNFYKYKNAFYQTFYSFFYPGMPFDKSKLDISPEAQKMITAIRDTNRLLS